MTQATEVLTTYPARWYRKPGGSVHAFRGVWTLCKRFMFQASWDLADPALSERDREDRCPSCQQLLDPPSVMSEATLIHAYGGLPTD